MPKKQPKFSAQGEQSLMLELWDPRLADNLNDFVRFVYPWGKENTPLADQNGPRNWQDQVLKDLSAYILKAKTRKLTHEELINMFRAAIASGRGIGKSALFGWLGHWHASTRLGSSTWVAANSEPQLKTKTFPELSKWFTLAINDHWFEQDATKIYPAEWFAKAVERDLKIDPSYWYVAAQLWNEQAPDAFAGAHNVYGEMALFDEASGIPGSIWTVQQGVFTEKIIDRYWLAFSNPRRPSGAFFECFHKNREDWLTYQIDSRTVDIAQDGAEAIIREHGADSDEAKVEVYGQFPSKGQNQFIGRTDVEEALKREVQPDQGAPLVMGVDPARFGDDNTVIGFRRGRDAKSIPWVKANGWSTTETAAKVAELASKHNPSAIFVDGGGVGGGVVDQLKGMGYRVIEVQSGESAQNKDKYQNRRAEMWDRMREWIGTGCLPDMKGITDDLCNLEYGYTLTNQIKLERKDELKKRGFASPDMADALALTFAATVARTDLNTSRHNRRLGVAKNVDYNVLG
jgi:hypothetical protein